MCRVGPESSRPATSRRVVLISSWKVFGVIVDPRLDFCETGNAGLSPAGDRKRLAGFDFARDRDCSGKGLERAVEVVVAPA